MIRTPGHALRRVRQTFEFSNGPQVLSRMAMRSAPWGRDELTFRLPGEGAISCPNSPAARVPVYEVFIEDAYHLRDLTRGLRDDFVALDVGGHVGCFSVALARQSPAARVHSYEASPSTAQWLMRNVADNDLSDRILTHNSALSDHSGFLDFQDNGRASALNGVTAPTGHLVRVPCVTFEDAVSQAGPVDLVKMDVEGGEYEIVLSSPQSSWRAVKKVVLEHHPVPGHSWDELREFFFSAGFAVSRHEEVLPGLGTAWLTRI